MCPDAQPKYPDIPRRHHKIPQEIPTRKTLYQPARTRVAIHPLNHRRAHLTALFIREHDPQRQTIDETALDHRHDVHVPVYPCAPVQLRVYVGEQRVRDQWR